MKSYFAFTNPGSTGKGERWFLGRTRPSQLTVITAIGLATCFSACSGSDPVEGLSDPTNPFTATSDGVITDNSVVAVLAMDAPEAQDFILSATLPVPPGTVTDGALSVPLSVAGVGEIASPTQVEVVSRYPDASQGADVINILAHVRRPEPAQPGDRIEFKVGLHPHQRYDLELEDDVNLLLSAPDSIKLIGTDAMGHVYAADLLDSYRDDTGAEVQMDGVCARRIRTHEVMMPGQVQEGANGTLPHMMGVHSFLTVYRGQDFATLDLHVHNGMDGRDSEVVEDDLINELYFKDLSLQLPEGWKVTYAFDRPNQSETAAQGGYTRTSLVEPLPGNKMHVMRPMAHFVRRLVITKDSAMERAKEQATMRYTAFCTPGTAPVGADLYSWWNEDTARYWPQNHRLPELDYIGTENLRGELQIELDRFETQLAQGTAGPYPYVSARLGWAHPWSVGHGGMPGGHEINTFAGLETAWTGSWEGLRMSQLRLSGMVDRQAQVLYDKNGDHADYADYVIHSAEAAPILPLGWYGTPSPSDTTFDFANAPSHQITHVANNGLRPDYYGAMMEFQCNDYQHFIRYTHDMKTLAWLTNDPLSKELLEAASENFRLSYHEFPSSHYAGSYPGGQKGALDSVNEFPGLGVPAGRAEAWGIDAAIAAYAMGDDELRARYRPWFDRTCEIFEKGQSTCTGNLMSYHIWNHFSGVYRVRQAMENAFLENMLMGLVSTVYDGVDPAQTTSLNQVIVDSVRSSFSGRFYNEAEAAPYFNNATGPRDIELGNFCQSAPAGTTSPYVNITEYYSSLAYAYELSGDSFFMQRASQMLGGGDVWARLQEGQGVNLINTAALVALTQNLNVQ